MSTRASWPTWSPTCRDSRSRRSFDSSPCPCRGRRRSTRCTCRRGAGRCRRTRTRSSRRAPSRRPTDSPLATRSVSCSTGVGGGCASLGRVSPPSTCTRSPRRASFPTTAGLGCSGWGAHRWPPPSISRGPSTTWPSRSRRVSFRRRCSRRSTRCSPRSARWVRIPAPSRCRTSSSRARSTRRRSRASSSPPSSLPSPPSCSTWCCRDWSGCSESRSPRSRRSATGTSRLPATTWHWRWSRSRAASWRERSSGSGSRRGSPWCTRASTSFPRPPSCRTGRSPRRPPRSASGRECLAR